MFSDVNRCRGTILRPHHDISCINISCTPVLTGNIAQLRTDEHQLSCHRSAAFLYAPASAYSKWVLIFPKICGKIYSYSAGGDTVKYELRQYDNVLLTFTVTKKALGQTEYVVDYVN